MKLAITRGSFSHFVHNKGFVDRCFTFKLYFLPSRAFFPMVFTPSYKALNVIDEDKYLNLFHHILTRFPRMGYLGIVDEKILNKAPKQLYSVDRLTLTMMGTSRCKGLSQSWLLHVPKRNAHGAV